MDDSKRKTVMVGIVITCIVLAVGITVYNNTGSPPGRKDKVLMMCSDPDCGETFEMTGDEYIKQSQEAGGDEVGGMGGMMDIGPVGVTPTVTCRHCGKDSAKLTTKCEKCDYVFIMNYEAPAEGEYPDRCPECKYSAMEESINR